MPPGRDGWAGTRDPEPPGPRISVELGGVAVSGLRGVLVDRLEDLEAYQQAWDELAVLNRKPYCSPAWVLSWWRHARPSRSALKTVVVLDGTDLVGVAPVFADRGVGGVVRHRLMGSSRRDFLVSPELEEEATRIVGAVLGTSEPTPDVFMLEGVPSDRRWPLLLTQAWPAGRLTTHRQFTQPAPIANLEGRSYDEWFGSKSRNFRQGMRRRVRQLEAAGARVRLTAADSELPGDLEAFARLHHQRWATRGGSGVLDEQVQRMLADSSRALIGHLRFRLWSIKVGGETISSHIFLSAGGETTYWLGGFDERWGRFQPAIVTIFAAIEHAFSVGDRRFDLGVGGQPYKYRFSDAEDHLEWTLLVRSGLKAPLARGQMLRLRTRMGLAERLPPSVKRQLRRAVSLATAGRRST
jgi:CelD/BcsL family acetyltransferase involved in cellulose biosynthesis